MTQALAGLEGVKTVEVSHPQKRAVVEYDPAMVTLQEMLKAHLRAGYAATPGSSEKILKSAPGPIGECPFGPEVLVCYCYDFTARDIEQDCIRNGRSTIMAKIAAGKKAGGCDCANTNPKGR